MPSTPYQDLIDRYAFWILVPDLETDDPNLQHYYDFSQSLAEYTRVFDTLRAQWQWQPVTMQNREHVIRSIRTRSNGRLPLVVNLCDGDEINGTPGISVIHTLESEGLPYTGSDAHFYAITTSKISMKEAFDSAGVATAPWSVIGDRQEALQGIFDRLGAPLILKPAVSGGSMGLTIRNVVEDESALWQRMDELRQGYRGWDLTDGGVLAERFIKGAEYTSLIIGSSDRPGECIVYAPVERIFHPSLPENERFLSFDRLWEIYEDETPMPDNGNFYTYEPVAPDTAAAICQLSIEAFCAVGGQGYARVDIRRDAQSGHLYVLEVNAQCGLSEDEDYTSIGAILRVSNKTFAEMTMEIIREAIRKQNLSAQSSPSNTFNM